MIKAVVEPGFEYLITKIKNEVNDRNDYRNNYSLVVLIVLYTFMAFYVLLAWFPFINYKCTSVLPQFTVVVVPTSEVAAVSGAVPHRHADEGLQEALLGSALRQHRRLVIVGVVLRNSLYCFISFTCAVFKFTRAGSPPPCQSCSLGLPAFYRNVLSC